MCGGANHGTGKVVATVIKEGKVKAVDFSEEDMLRAYKYREIRDYARTLITSTSTWHMKRELEKIEALRVYDPRLKRLIEFIAKYVKK
jgi:hypothetical protein